ncbi:MAG: ATP-binding cassette domain-containing protein [Candidatus Eremiobacteraeota bacterium]|nr:ATP-binding cassette domain-containing protein [Candidatus Eremiobacteraeota bacterium]
MNQTLVETRNLTKTFCDRTLFDDISFTIATGEKVGLVGLNGSGKTTLFNVIMGNEEYDSGIIRKIPKKIKIGHLPQWIEFVDKSVGEVLYNSTMEANITEEWQYRKVLENIMEEMNLDNIPLDLPTSRLSGGERVRLHLAGLLMMDPDFLILDEPTNFLDIKGLSWMESFIRKSNRGILLVSHDRYFLDNVVDRIIEIDNGSMFEYAGNYSFYRLEKVKRIELQWKKFREQKREVRRLKYLIQRENQFALKAQKGPVRTDNSGIDWGFVGRRAAKHNKKAKSLEKRIERMDNVEKPRKNYFADIRFEGESSSNVVARAEGLCKRFGDNLLYENVNFTVSAGDKVGILGENGSGKTTLLEILQGVEPPTEGKTYLVESDRIGYFSQIFKDMDDDIIVLDQVIEKSGLDMPSARNLLASFLFIGRDVFKRTGDLSIGERSRLVLACIKAKEPEVLILDEPTNHLDVDTTEIMENALDQFSGTIIIISHDRCLLDNLVNRLLVIEKGTATMYPGNYSYYASKSRLEPVEYIEDEKKRMIKLLRDCKAVEEET